jgi:hypothetical protein
MDIYMRSPTESRTHLDERIINYIEGKRINIDKVYGDRKEKEEFIQNILGYSRLKVGRDKYAPLNQCNDARISLMAKGAYYAAKKRLQKKK